MYKKKVTTEEIFVLALQNHQKNNLQVAENLYNEVLKMNSYHFCYLYDSLSNLVEEYSYITPSKRAKIIPELDGDNWEGPRVRYSWLRFF